MELNPNNPVTMQMHDHWHKMCAVLMLKTGAHEVDVTPEDVQRLADEGEDCAIQAAYSNKKTRPAKSKDVTER